MSGVTRGESVAALAGAALFASSFAPRWGSISTEEATLTGVGRVPGTTGGFDAWWGYGPAVELALALGLAVAIVVVARIALRLRVPPGLYVVAGLLTTALLAAAVAIGPDLDRLEGVAGLHVTRGPLLYVAVGLALLMTIGGRAHRRSAAALRRGRRRRG